MTEAQRRMQQFLLFRMLVAVLGFLLVAFYVAWISPETRPATSAYLYSILCLYLAIGVVARVTFPRWRYQPSFYSRQILIDFVLQAMLVWATGGVVSIFSPVLFVTLAAATGVASARGANILATLTTAFLVGSTLAYCVGLVPATSSWSAWFFRGQNSAVLTSFLLANVLGLYAISFLGSKLSYGLRNAEHTQEEIIESMAEGLLAVDQNGEVVHLNVEARKLLGLRGDRDAFRGRSLDRILASDRVSERDGDGARDVPSDPLREVLEAFQTGRRRRFETILPGEGGRRRPVEIKISSVYDDKKKLRCRVGLFSDLTLKRQVESAGRRIRKLEELQVMAMGIAHEIRNPLASIRGCVQEIARAAADGPQRRYAGIVMRESDRLDRIIEDFLRYARSTPFDLVPTDLTAVVDEAVTLLRRREDLGGRVIEWTSSEERLRVYGDRDRLVQVFLNLGINAIHATDPVSGRIEVTLERHALMSFDSKDLVQDEAVSVDGIAIAFRDNGRGIDPADLDRIFTPFFTTKSTGSGLGLSIVDRVVRDHLGVVEVETDAGAGTVFRVCLPVFGASGSGSEAMGNEERSIEAGRPSIRVLTAH